MAKNELIPSEKFNIVTLEGDMSEIIAEEMDGLGTIPFDNVKIPSGGSLAFEIPTEDPENPDTEKEIVGVILFHHPINGYWANKYDGQNNNPDCSSYDGKQGIEPATGCVNDCATCPRNQFGSGEGGTGKACKNMHRCYILREGNPIPILLTLPPTSLKSLRDYLGKQVVLKGMRSYQVITKITLKKETSSGNIVYSKAVFTKAGILEGDKLTAAKNYAEQLKAMNKNIEITNEEFEAPAPEAPKPAPVEDEGLPFSTVEENTAPAEEGFQEALPV